MVVVALAMTSQIVVYNGAWKKRPGAYLMSLTPGDEYISSWRRPFRNKNSTAAKSRLSIFVFFSNSFLFVL